MEFNEFKHPSKSKSKSLVALSLIALVAIGGVVYYTWPREVAGEDTPPVLEMSTSALQGAFVDDKIKFLNYTDEDTQLFEDFKANTENFSDVFGAPTVVSKEIHFYSFKSDRSFKFAVDALKPVVENQVFFFFYSPGGEDGYTEKGFYVYPQGPFAGTFEVKAEELESKTIPAGRVFGVISKLDTEGYGYQTEKDQAVVFKPLDNSLKGWVQVVATEDPKGAVTSTVSDRIDLNSNSKVQIWIQNAENSFKRVDLENLNSEIGDYKIIWLKLKEKDSVSPAS